MCNSTPIKSDQTNIAKVAIRKNSNIKLMFKSQITNRLRHDISQIVSFKLSPMDELHRANLAQTRSPHPNDVLCGRGGGINSHPGNKAFRQWVRIEKESYNLAITKVEKTRISRKIVNKVRNLSPPGRFLMKDSSKPNFWVEIDDVKTMAKTSQALREGAPTIRAVHQQLNPESNNPRKKRKRRNSAVIQRETSSKVEATTSFNPSTNIGTHSPNEPYELDATTTPLQASESPMPHLSMTQSSNNVEMNKTSVNSKHDEIPTSIEEQQKNLGILSHTRLSQKTESATFSHEPSKSFPDALSQLSTQILTEQELLSLSKNHTQTATVPVPAPAPLSELKRTHSLSLSDIFISNDNEEFDDPFADDNPMDISEKPPSDKLILESNDANEKANMVSKSQNDDKRYVNTIRFQLYLNYITNDVNAGSMHDI